MNIYVGNLSHRVTEEQLVVLFGEFGYVASCNIIKDKMTGRSKGFGFIEMPEQNEAKQAISALNGRDFEGRNLVVNDVDDRRRPRP